MAKNTKPEATTAAEETATVIPVVQKPSVADLLAEKEALQANKDMDKVEREKRLREIRRQLRAQGTYVRGPRVAGEAKAASTDEAEEPAVTTIGEDEAVEPNTSSVDEDEF